MKTCIRFFLFFALLFAQAPSGAWAQHVGWKTNLIGDALLNANMGFEFGLSKKWTLDIKGQLNSWELSHHEHWKHWGVQPSMRYWFCDRFAGHFFGIHGHGGQFNIGNVDVDFQFLGTHFSRLADSRFQGWFAGGGLSYGYAWMLGRHWNFEAEIGFGYSYVRYDRFECEGCEKKVESDQEHHYVGPTKAALPLPSFFVNPGYSFRHLPLVLLLDEAKRVVGRNPSVTEIAGMLP